MAKKKTYILEVYELHACKYEIEAKNLVEALNLYQDGGARIGDEGTEYIETAERYGMRLTDLRCSAADLKRIKADFADHADTLPGIRSIEIE